MKNGQDDHAMRFSKEENLVWESADERPTDSLLGDGILVGDTNNPLKNGIDG